MGARQLLAVGMSGGHVRISVEDADGGGVVLQEGAREVVLTSRLAGLFKALLGASAPLDKAQLKALVWKTQSIAAETVQNTITKLRGALAPLFESPVVAIGNPARYALDIGLFPDTAAAEAASPPPRWPARLIVCASQSLCCSVAAGLALQSIEVSEGSGIILATGRTAGEVFHAAVALARKRRFAGLEKARFFTDMETLGVGAGHATSRQAIVRRTFIEPLRAAGYRIGEDRVAFFPGFIENEADHFERVLPVLRATPLAAHLVSVSPQGGVIGYSAGEVRRSLDELVADDCKVTTMSEAERRYMDVRLPSPSMLTIGLLNVLRADSLVVPIYHHTKRDILRVMLRTNADAAIPATLLKLHHKATVITTEALVDGLDTGENAMTVTSERDIVSRLGLFAV